MAVYAEVQHGIMIALMAKFRELGVQFPTPAQVPMPLAAPLPTAASLLGPGIVRRDSRK